MNPHKREVIASMEDFVKDQLQLLKSVDDSWQPDDYLPDMTGEGWEDNIREFRTQAEALPDEVLVVLVGDMVTEEALPT